MIPVPVTFYIFIRIISQSYYFLFTNICILGILLRYSIYIISG